MTLPPPFEEPPPDDPERLKMALKIAAENITILTDARQQLTAALMTAMNLIDRLVDDLRHAGITPSGQSVVARATLDQAMTKLLHGEKRK